MPFREAAAATGGGGVLRDEDGMAAERGLAAILGGRGRRQPLGNEPARMDKHLKQPLRAQIGPIVRVQREPLPECRPREAGEKVVLCSHHGVVMSEAMILC